MTKDLHFNWRTNSQGGRGGAKEEPYRNETEDSKDGKPVVGSDGEDSRNSETTNEIK